MALSRREFLQLLGLSTAGIFAAGCTQGTQMVSRPRPDWPTDWDHPQPLGPAPAAPGAANPYTPVTPSASPSAAAPAAGSPGLSPATINVGPLHPIPRAAWAKAPPITQRIQPMNGVAQITVHHEGWTVVNFTDVATTAARLDSIRQSHKDRLGAGDIGYHYVIDRAGRLWQGRDVRYQGAHVHEHNPHNVGVMCLGNFDKQSPTQAQYTTLRATLAALMGQYRVPVRLVYTHQELNPTECPGNVMQGHMIKLRRGGIA